MKLTKGNRIPSWTCGPCIEGMHRQCKKEHRVTLMTKQGCLCKQLNHDEYRLREYLR